MKQLLTANIYHVSPSGDNANPGTAAQPFRSISAAANVAQPGDTITVHEGIYRERITPPRGGASEARRIVYQAAVGEEVVIKGSEVIRDWQPWAGDVWKVTLPNSFFGSYNPYCDLIAGDWFADNGRPHHTGEVYFNGRSLYEVALLEQVLKPRPHPQSRDPAASTWTWFCESDGQSTYLYANFHGQDPNRELVEINVRDACFYPSKTGCDYITVSGFRLSQAATQWAPPTAEQIGLIGTNWSKGWIIQNNVISDSKCSGITLGKDRATGHNVWSKEPNKDGSVHYNEVVGRALAEGWSREKIGSHIVRNNTIFNCEQTGICGSLGAVYSEISHNHIYNIWTKRQFEGAEIAGIKFHAPIDAVIKNNRIHNAGRGLWMDWMTQGTQITANLCYGNTTDDLFVEVNHGPFLVDNNVMLSPTAVQDWSEGGAFVHNLFGGVIYARQELTRSTPYHDAHATTVAGLGVTRGGDHRFFNNIFLPPSARVPGAAPLENKALDLPGGFGLGVYDVCEAGLLTAGNVYYRPARPYAHETDPVVVEEGKSRIDLTEEGDRVYLSLDLGTEVGRTNTGRITSETLGHTRISGLPFERADGSPMDIDQDYFGAPRPASNPTSGPFQQPPGNGPRKLVVW